MTVFTNIDEKNPRKPTIEDLWNVGSIRVIDNNRISNDEKAKHMIKEMLRSTKGRYQFTRPWKEEYGPDLPMNHRLAMGSLRSFALKLKETPVLMQKYHAIIQDQ